MSKQSTKEEQNGRQHVNWTPKDCPHSNPCSGVANKYTTKYKKKERLFVKAFPSTTFATTTLTFLRELAATGEDLIPFQLDGEDAYLLLDPEVCLQALANTQHSSKNLPLMDASRITFGDGLFSSEEPLHLRQRRMMQPIFHTRRMDGLEDTMQHSIDIMLKDLEGVPTGTPIDIMKAMFSTTLRVIGEVVCSNDLTRQANPISQFVDHAIRYLVGQLSEQDLFLAQQRFEQAMEGVVQEHQQHPDTYHDLLSLLVAARDPETGAAMPHKQLSAELVTLVVAGHGTTALALTWMCYEIARHPDCQGKVQEELQTVLHERRPTLADLPNLPYIMGVFKEALRLYPPDTLIVRRVEREQMLSKQVVPAGSIICVVPYVLQRDPRWWPEPDTFVPERWRNAAQPKAYLPWGSGAHVCIGRPLAEREAPLIFAALMQRYPLSLPPEAPTIEPELRGFNIFPSATEIDTLLHPR